MISILQIKREILNNFPKDNKASMYQARLQMTGDLTLVLLKAMGLLESDYRQTQTEDTIFQLK